MSEKTEVVKVQQPLFPRNAPALVYAVGRSRARQMKLTDRVLKQMEDSPKAFFSARWTGTDWKIGERVADRDW